MSLEQTVEIPPQKAERRIYIDVPPEVPEGSCRVVFFPKKPPAKSGKREIIPYLKGEVRIPDDFDTMCRDEIIAMFEGDE